MINRSTLKLWTTSALEDLGGRATVVEVMKKVWEKHQSEIEASGDAFYKWQYDIRWSAMALRKEKKMKSTKESKKGVWELA